MLKPMLMFFFADNLFQLNVSFYAHHVINFISVIEFAEFFYLFIIYSHHFE